MPFDPTLALLYSKPSSNMAVTGGTTTISLAEGTENPRFPLSRLIDLDPATSFKSSGAGNVRVQWAYSGAQHMEAAFIPMYNMPAGTVIRVEGNGSASWGGPALSVSYTIPAYEGEIPRGIFVNLTEAAGYSPSGGYAYWSVFVPSIGGEIALGEVHLSSLLEAARHLEDSPEEVRVQLVIEHEREDGGRFVYRRGIGMYMFSGEVELPLAELLDYRALWADTLDGFYPFCVVIHIWETQPEGFMMLWKNHFSHRHVLGDRYRLSIQWVTMSRGRVP